MFQDKLGVVTKGFIYLKLEVPTMGWQGCGQHYVSQLSLISPRKMQRIAPTFWRGCYLKNHFPFVIFSVYNYVFRKPSALEPSPR